MPANPVLVEITRGALVESIHRGAIAIADAHGRLVAALGDVARSVFPRSSSKMFQAMPLVETGAADRFHMSDEELSLACASHSGEEGHVKAVAAFLARIGASQDDLACGPHWPGNEAASRALAVRGEVPCPLHNNCSGKHAGFVALAKHLNADPRKYAELDHPVQKAVRAMTCELCDVKEEVLVAGIDGCAAPNYAMPLAAFARGLAKLADPSSLAPRRRDAALRLQDAVRKKPWFVAGTGRACTALIEGSTGGVTVKTGAEGYYAAIVPSLGLGVALKMDDGGTRAAEAAIAAVLDHLGVLAKGETPARALMTQAITNTRGTIVGHRRVSDTLKALLVAV